MATTSSSTDDLDDLMECCLILAATGDAVEVAPLRPARGARVMKYLVLLMGDGELKPWTQHTPEEQGELMGRFGAFDEACRARDGVEILVG